MEQEIRAELWKVLESSDLESVTSKEVGKGLGPEVLAGQRCPLPGSVPVLDGTQVPELGGRP